MSRAAVAQVSFTRGSSIRCHFWRWWLKYSFAQVAQILVSTWLRFSLTFTITGINKIAQYALNSAKHIKKSNIRADVMSKLAIEFFELHLDDFCVRATVEMLMAADNPWHYFDVLLRVAESSALDFLQRIFPDEKQTE